MKETERIQQLFENLYQGNPWLDVTLAGTLSELSIHQVLYKPDENWNSIWEITNHIISWRENVLERVKGNFIITPENNYFTYIVDTSELAWLHTLKRLHDSQHHWIAFLKKIHEGELEKIYKSNNHSYAEHIHGIIQHDAYHLGQIVMLAKHAVK